MSYRIEETTEGFELPDDALCLGPDGWFNEAHQLVIETIGSLDDALAMIWRDQKGILGFGELVFYRVEGFRGFIVFHPAEETEET